MLALKHTMLDQRPWLTRYAPGVPHTLDYPDEPAYCLLEQTARRAPTRVACRFLDQQMTYAELLTLARRAAHALHQRGVRPGDRVGLLLPNIPEYLISLFGVWMAGAIAVPMSPLLVPGEVAAILQSTDCRAVVTLDILLPLVCKKAHPSLILVASLQDRLHGWQRLGYRYIRLRRLGFHPSYWRNTVQFDEALASAEPLEIHRPRSSDPATIQPTGGTTGSSKAVTLLHRNLLANAIQLDRWTQHNFGEEVILAVLPFFHCYGIMACGLAGIAQGATLILHHRFRASGILELIERWRPTTFPVVPAMLVAMNEELRRKHYDLSSLRDCISGGAPLDLHIAEEFGRYSKATVVEGFGLSEASPVTHAGPLDGTARAGSVGIPLPDTDAKIVDAETGEHELPPGEVGELVIRGPQVMAGYWNDPEATAKAIRNGWLFTGDLATKDEDGFFRIVDRKKDLIITSGFNVYPTEVEKVLRQCPGVGDVAVFGVPDLKRGELVKAVVVPAKGQHFHRSVFDDFAHENLAAYKRPRLVEVAAELPRNPLGKVLRRILRTHPGVTEETKEMETLSTTEELPPIRAPEPQV
jgi:long-chain acyl-CoA synthetase